MGTSITDIEDDIFIEIGSAFSEVSVNAPFTGGGTPVNHLRIDYDDVTIGKNSAEKLYVKNGGITSLQIANESITRGDLFGELLADFDDASTLGGCGPSDFAPAYGSGRYIRNQKNSVQTAGFSISGNALIGGNIGVGTISPLYNLGVNGSFRATSKSFDIPHPLDPEHKHLVHGCLEGPEFAVYYRGEKTGERCRGCRDS